MANVRTIRRRIRSVQNTAKVTRAMEMIAASKMRRAQQRVLQGRPYALKMQEVLGHLARQQRREKEALHPLLVRRPDIRRIEVVHITPDRGLCGGLPSNINRVTAQFVLAAGVPVSVVTVGRKGRDFMVRYGRDVRGVFTDLGDRPFLVDTLPIARLVMEDYRSGLCDQVYLVYSQFVSTMVQRPVTFQLLPIQPVEETAVPATVDYIYEPGRLDVLTALLPRFVEMQVYHGILEAIASEQSARMVAMRNATDNANQMVEELTLFMNKVRQETITRELLDIVGGAVVLE